MDMKLLLIEDDKILGESLKEYLEQYNFDVDWIYDDRDFDYHFSLKEYDIILIDLMLKFGKGEDLLKIIKRKKQIPVIIITAKYQIEDKERCFKSGADDYMVKPFDPKEIVLRINNLVKIYSNVDEKYLLYDAVIDFEAHKIISGQEEYHITKKECDLLFILLKNRGKVVSNECIMNYVWGDNVVGTDSIRTYIKKLRKMLGDEKIKTAKGIGYIIE